MSSNPHSKKFGFGLLVSLIVLATASKAEAYIGPGAGFAFFSGFLVVFTAMVSAVFALLTWPIRWLIRTIRRRHAFARSRIKRFVILGLDGMDPGMARRLMDEGKLPHLAALAERGCFKSLATTLPSMSPVAWSSFQTGVNPGKHNIFDFLTRDKQTYQPRLSSVQIRGPRRTLSLGKYRFALGKADVRLLRKSTPFWKILGKHGIFSAVIRVPITFPPEKFRGVLLSGMCVPDLRGTQGTFSFYTTARNGQEDHTGGERYRVSRVGNTITTELLGPENPLHKDRPILKCPFVVTIDGEESGKIRLNGSTYKLKKDVYTDWLRVSFKAGAGVKVQGICKFLLQQTSPDFELYVTPINIDPEKPVMPISYPAVYSTYLAKLQGPFATLGLAEDSWALNEKVLIDESFIEQCVGMDDEREKMFFDALDKVKDGLCVCVFDGTDRLQHTFWRDIDDEHPARRERDCRPERNVIAELYQRMDRLVGRTIDKCKGKDTALMVISDHGFSTFRRGVDLNRWLADSGYLKLREGHEQKKHLESIDWTGTRAFAVGLAGIFLNLKGRESQGIVDPSEEAERLREEIGGKLAGLSDPDTGQKAIKQVYNAMKIYRGPYKGEAPDLLVGYERGYRASWETAIGEVTEAVFHDNTKAWSGDHCIDPSLVPGVLFCNRSIDSENPRLMDIGPTVLDMFGIKVPSHMDGRPLAVAEVNGKQSRLAETDTKK